MHVRFRMILKYTEIVCCKPYDVSATVHMDSQLKPIYLSILPQPREVEIARAFFRTTVSFVEYYTRTPSKSRGIGSCPVFDICMYFNLVSFIISDILVIFIRLEICLLQTILAITCANRTKCHFTYTYIHTYICMYAWNDQRVSIPWPRIPLLHSKINSVCYEGEGPEI